MILFSIGFVEFNFFYILVALVDFTKKDFNGYLINKNQPYNMYLKIGIASNFKN